MTALVAALSALLLALSASPVRAAPPHIAAELLAEGQAGPGETVTLAFRMVPEPGWHGYWLNPGDAGQGMTAAWSLPAGASAGTLRYPVPGTLVIAGLMNHVYEHEYAVLVPLSLPQDARAGQVLPISVEAQWLACSDKLCVPEAGKLATTVTVGPKGKGDPRFDTWRQALPAPLGSEASFAFETGRLRIGIPLPKAVRLENPHLFIGEDRVIDYAANQTLSRIGDLLVVDLELAKFAPTRPATISGVLRLNPAGDGVSISARPGAVPSGALPVKSAPVAGAPPLALLLLGALVGGLMLNIMPCVFPILSLKALSLARAGESEAQARSEGLAYTAGVIAACLALGGLMLALRAGGEEIGWAFQLQEPLVVAGLLLLATAITANLAGAFEFAVPGFASEGSPQGAFATGLLAAFVATPCTGPFMAAAMGAALLLPVAAALALFAALGLGIALPFLALAFIPALRRRLPRPGPWMVRFRRWMALPMGLTALALLWLCWRVGGDRFALAASVAAIALVAILSITGMKQHRGERSLPQLTVALLLLALGASYGLMKLAAPGKATQAASLLASKPFSETALAKARASGSPVFVYFTADWCLTCKVNEKIAIEREATRAAFERAGVVVLRGDWTRRDPEITRYLTAQGAAGLPLYLWYPKGSGALQQLPQLLGPDSLPALVR